jgi:MFS family permease
MTPSLPATPTAAYPDRRGWLIAFGVVDILIAVFSLLVLVVQVFAVLTLNTDSLPQGSLSPTAALAIGAAFYGVVAALFLTAGVGSIRCENWARITMLVVSGLWLGFGILGTLIVSLMLPTILRQQAGIPLEGRHLVVTMIFGIMGFFMIVMPAVFLIFYSRKSVKATCLRAEPVLAPAGTAVPQAKTPVAVVVLAVWQGLGALAVLAYPIVRAAVVFGLVLRGPLALGLLLAQSVLSGYASWSIYRRRFAGWAIALFTTVFWTASWVTAMVRRDMLQLYREMGFSEQQMRVYQQFPQMLTITWGASLVAFVGLLGFLLYCKKYFSRTEQV